MRWLKPPKDLPLPAVLVHELGHTGGEYWSPSKVPIWIEGRKTCDRSRGIIVLDPEADASTLAHEFRHHLQVLNNWTNDSPAPELVESWFKDFKRKGIVNPWQETMYEYFTTSKMELDALLYEHKKYPTVYSIELLQTIHRRQSERKHHGRKILCDYFGSTGKQR